MNRKDKKRTAPVIEALEPRMMFSADMFGGAVDNPAADDPLASLLDDTAAVLEKQTAQLYKEQTDAALAEPLSSEGDVTSPLEEASPRLELVFVDTDTPDYQQLVDDLLSNSDNSRCFEVILLDNNSDGIEQITAALPDYHGIDAIHLISHGEDGVVDLGNTQLNNQNLVTYQAQLQSWGEHLNADADILFYGCELAASTDGQALIDKIATLTAADIAASDDLTGNWDMGGDWELEYKTGLIETGALFSDATLDSWDHTLAAAVDVTSTGVSTGGNILVSHTTSGSDRLMTIVVTLNHRLATDSVDSITYGSQSATFVGAEKNGDSRIEIWTLVAPDVGTNNVDVTFSGNSDGAAVGVTTFTGVDQANPITARQFNSGISGTAAITVASAAGELVYGGVSVDDPTDYNLIAGAGAGQENNWDAYGYEINAGGSTKAGAPSVDMAWSWAGADNWTAFALSIKSVPLTVDTTSDEADGDTSSIEALHLNKGADGKISLREAIEAANATPNGAIADTIRFNITDPLVDGAHTITLGSALPTITDTLILDGTSEPDFSGNPVIRIDGISATGTVDGLKFSATSDHSILRGLMITNFSGNGVQIDSGADGITLSGNWIGTAGAGTAVGVGNSNSGINVQGANTVIGGTGANEGNVITNNNNEGINITGSGATGTIIQGNIIGLDPDGSTGSGNTDVGIAVLSGADNTTIGGTTASARNVISNNFEGIEINSNNNTVQGNYIGTDITGTLDRGNRSDDGIEIQGNATGNLIGGTETGAGNLIAFNALDGVNIVNGSGNTVLGNQIHSNSDMGIDLGTTGVTSNDANDGDTGANNLQNYPAITTALLTGSNLTLSGTLDTNGATTSYRIEFFGNTAGTQDATNGEGRFFLGSTTVTTNGTGDGSFNDVILTGITLNEGDYVTATATKVDDAGQVGSDDQLAYGDTSEFAANVVIANGNNAPVLSGANDLNSINEDDVNNSGTLVSGLIAGQVSDADSGSSGGIAVVGVDNTNGTWEFTTNGGGIWTAFGSPSTAAARLLAGDVNTLVRFVPDADWNGTVTNGITFRAWDQTSGANGSSMAIDEGTRFTLDEFSSVSYSNNDGTNAWSTDWAEVDSNSAGSDPTDGRIRVSGNELKFQVASAGNSLSREVNLENATGATLSFSYDNALGGSATLLAQVSSDGGTTYDTVATFNSTINQGVGTQTIDLSSHLSSNTLVRFYVSGGETGAGINNLSIDNVQVEYTELGGGSSPFSSTTASASVVVNAMADTPSVTNTSTTEDTQSTSGLVITPNPADGSEVTHYKVTGITDGTLYKNDGVTQIINGDFITVAEGSAGLKFTPTADFNGSGTFTIQASTSNSDAGLGGGTTVATVNVAPVNDAPTDLITTSTSQSGLSLNEDGNDSYLVADNGLPSPLSQFTVEVQFEGNNFSNEVPFISYNTASGGDVLAINTMADNTLELDIGTGAAAFSNAINYNATLMDGQRHTLSVSWDNSAGDWSVYIDGALIDSNTGLSTGQTIPTGGTLMFGLEQDSVGGTFESQEYFNGELYDIRLFDDVRTATEVATNYTQTLPSNEPGMVANWIFDNLSTSGTIVESVGGNNLTVQHTSGTGFTPSNPELILSSPENSPNGTVVGTLSTIDPDRGDSFSYTLVDNAGGRFDIDSVSGDITVLDASLIDYETAASHNITVRVTDAGGLSYDEIFTIQVTDTNEAPVLDSAALTLIEGQTVGLSAANFGITDPDDTEFTFTISGLNGGYFQLSNNANVPITSFTSAQLNSGLVEFVDDGNEVMPAFDVTVNDGALDSNILAATISYTGVNDAATISVTAADTAVTEDDAGNNTATGTVTISDPDTGEGALASSTATYGTVTVDGSGNWTYALNNGDPAVQALAAGETLTDTITFTSDDGTTQTQAITITGANDAAVIGGDTTAAVSEDGILSDSGVLTISDAESGEAVFLAQSSAASTNGYGTVDLDSAGNWTYNLDNSNATVQALAEGQTLTDSFTATSADGSTQVVNVTITGKDDATNITVTAADAAVTEDDAGNNTANGSVTVSDPDTGQGTLASSTANYGTVTVDGSGNWTYALDNSNASVQALAAGETLADTITFTSDDGTTQTQAITITGANDAAVIGGDASAAVSEDGIVSDTGALTISDADSGEAVFVAQSSAASANGYGTVDLDSAGNWTYNLDNSNATVQALAEGQTLTDNFTATSADGSTQVVNVTITGKDDATNITVTAADAAVTEDDAGNNTANGSVTVSDPDTGQGTLASSTANYGTVTVDGSGNWTYALNNGDPAVQALAAGETLTDTITFTSDDGTTQTQTITITGTNDVAVIGGDTTAAVSEDGIVSDTGALTISDADSGEAVFVAQSSAASANGYGTVDLDSAGNWTYNLDNSNATVQALAEGQTLTDNFTATSAEGSTQVVNVTITGKDDATNITVTAADSTVTEDDAGNNTATGTVTISDPDTGEGTLASSTANYGTVTVDGSGNWTYALDNSNASVQALAAGETLADTITFTSDDGTTQTQTITITGTNDAAVIGGDTTAAVSEDGILSDSGTLTISDADSDEAVFVSQTSAPSTNGYGTVDLDSAGNWTYSLDNSNATVQALAEGQTLTDSFTATSADGSTQVVNVTITGKDDATTINLTAADTAVTEDDASNNTANGTVTVTDPDTGQGTLASSAAIYGTVTVDGSGNWTYALDNSNASVQALAAGETLADTITFTSDDGSTQTQNITITGTNDAAVIGGDASAAVSEDGTLTDSGALTISDAESGEAVFLAQSSSASTNGYGTVDLDSAGNWTYSLDNSNATVQALAEGQTLTDSFTATSADGSTQVVNVTITGKDDATNITVTAADAAVTEDDA
ncbi:VCBS domain-containing protein, partial [Marinobacter sp. MDS2]|uniref:VCBS domain-containing protein n=1 Tax=Marinobacter sp. MDS2 TaxID=3065961 RepID=UPI00273CB004